MDNNIFMIEKHEIYVGKGGWQMKGLRQYVLDQLIYMAERVYRGLRLGVQAAGSSDYQALKGVNKRKRVEFYEKRSIGLCY